MDKMSFIGLRIALYVGGTLARGMITSRDVDDAIREKMETEGVDEDAFEDISTFVYALQGFADDIRAAERKKLPITKMFGETLPG